MLDRGLQTFGRALVPVIAALQVALVGLAVACVALAELLDVLPRQLDLQRFRYLAPDRLLHFEDIGPLAVEALPPDLPPFRRLDQVHLDLQVLAALHDPPR